MLISYFYTKVNEEDINVIATVTRGCSLNNYLQQDWLAINLDCVGDDFNNEEYLLTEDECSRVQERLLNESEFTYDKRFGGCEENYEELFEIFEKVNLLITNKVPVYYKAMW